MTFGKSSDDRALISVAWLITGCSTAASFITGYRIPQGDPVAGLIIGLMLSGVTLLVALGLRRVDLAISRRDWVRASISLAAWLLFFAAEVGTCSMFHAGERGGSVQKAEFQNAVYTDTRTAVADLEGKIKLWEGMLASAGWDPTVTADGKRALLESATLAIKQETARGGCGPKCLELTAKKNDLEAQIAKLEASQKTALDLDVARQQLASLRDKAAATKQGDSNVLAGAAMWASLGTGTLAPDDKAVGWAVLYQSQFLGLVGSIAAAIAFWWAAMSERLGWMPDGGTVISPAPKPSDNADLLHKLALMMAPTAATPPAAPGEKVIVERHFDNNGLTREAIHKALSAHGLVRAA